MTITAPPRPGVTPAAGIMAAAGVAPDMVAGYLALIQAGKKIFYRAAAVTPATAAAPAAPQARRRLLRRRAARFSTATAAGQPGPRPAPR